MWWRKTYFCIEYVPCSFFITSGGKLAPISVENTAERHFTFIYWSSCYDHPKLAIFPVKMKSCAKLYMPSDIHVTRGYTNKGLWWRSWLENSRKCQAWRSHPKASSSSTTSFHGCVQLPTTIFCPDRLNKVWIPDTGSGQFWVLLLLLERFVFLDISWIGDRLRCLDREGPYLRKVWKETPITEKRRQILKHIAPV